MPGRTNGGHTLSCRIYIETYRYLFIYFVIRSLCHTRQIPNDGPEMGKTRSREVPGPD